MTASGRLVCGADPTEWNWLKQCSGACQVCSSGVLFVELVEGALLCSEASRRMYWLWCLFGEVLGQAKVGHHLCPV